jgi:hypothetical protein
VPGAGIRSGEARGIRDDAGKNGLNLIFAHHGLTMNILLSSPHGGMVIWRYLANIPGKKIMIRWDPFSPEA